MAGIAESLISQIQQAGQPRIAKSTTTTTGEEAPNLAMLGFMLAMLLEGEKTKNIEPAIPFGAFEPVGGFMPTETIGETPLPAPSNPMETIMEVLGATGATGGTPALPQASTPTASSKTTPVQASFPEEGTLNIENILSQLSELSTTAPQGEAPASLMTWQQILDLIIPQKPELHSLFGPAWRR